MCDSKSSPFMTVYDYKNEYPVVVANPNFKFSNDTVVSFTIPDDAYAIEEDTYFNNGYLDNFSISSRKVVDHIKIPSSIKYIGERAFRGLQGLESVSFGQNYTQEKPLGIDCGAFSCNGLYQPAISVVNLPPFVTFYVNTNKPHSYSSVPFGNTIWSKTKTLHLSANQINVVDTHNPHVCESLNYIFPNLEYVVLDGYKKIPPRYFENCKHLKTVIAKDVETIEHYAFSNCRQLESISLPSAITINTSAFENCNSLIDIDIPNVHSIGYSSFNKCSNLKQLKLPNAQTIQKSAFQNCKSLTHLYLSDTIREIQSNVFSACTNLQYVYLPLELRSTIFRPDQFDSYTIMQKVCCVRPQTLRVPYHPWRYKYRGK